MQIVSIRYKKVVVLSFQMTIIPIKETETNPKGTEMASIITIERKNDNGKWVEFGSVQSCLFIEAFDYIKANMVGTLILDTRHTYKNGCAVHYYKTNNTPGGFDFRATLNIA